MKKISILIPCYNEEENVVPISEAVINELKKSLPEYDYEILFIDNDSKDNTRPLLREICRKNPKIKAIFNAKNFGQFNSPYYGMLQTTGDCTICMCCDFQDPIEMIPKLVHEWENGYKIVCAIKTTSKENKIIRFFRTCYYKLIKKMSDVEQIEHFTGFMTSPLLRCSEISKTPHLFSEELLPSSATDEKIFLMSRQNAEREKHITIFTRSMMRRCSASPRTQKSVSDLQPFSA